VLVARVGGDEQQRERESMVDAEEWVAADTVATQVTARILQNAFNGSPRPRPRQSNSYEAARQADRSQEQVNPALHKLVSYPPTWGVSHTLSSLCSGVCRVPFFANLNFSAIFA
jgi:hypothetical protein